MTKCNGIDCPIKDNCKRYLKRKDGQDRYFLPAPYNKTTKKCKKLLEVVYIFAKYITIKKYGEKEEREHAKMFRDKK
jgi:hypothetical protein